MINNLASRQMLSGGGNNVSSPLNIVTQSMLHSAMDNVNNIGTGKYIVTCYDYDGTILKQKRLNAGETFNLPTPPVHDRLTFQNWSASSPLNTDGQSITVNSDIDIGAIYTTVSGNTEFDIQLNAVTGLTITFQNLTGMTSINWGDGTTNNNLSHTYANYGAYTIEIIGDVSFGENIFGASISAKNYSLIFAKFAGNVSLGYEILGYCAALQSVTISTDIINVDERLFYNCYSLKNIVIPYSITSMGDYTFGLCYSLTSIVIPYTMTSIGQNFFNFCCSLKSVILPVSITTIPYRAFSTCYSLEKIVSLAQTLSISEPFSSNYCVKEYNFSKTTSVTAIGDVFSDINGACKIIVPDNLYSNYISAAGWSDYANYIYKESET